MATHRFAVGIICIIGFMQASPAFSSSDVKLTSSSSTSTSRVARKNRPPVISGTPAPTVMAGSLYSFTPSARDPDGDAISFSITGKPAWAVFSTATGKLSGTPGTSGIHSDIVISVTDARGASASLPAFSITVTSPAPSGTASLSWTPPVQYTDGTLLPVDQLSGYRVYHGTSPGAMNQIIIISGALSTSCIVDRLASGTHYFAVSAVTISGVESELSPVRTKTIL